MLLDEQVLRESVGITCTSCLTDLIKNISNKSVRNVANNEMNAEIINATLLLLFSEAPFRDYVTLFSFECLLRLPIISEEVIASMIAMSEEGVFEITSAAHLCFQDFHSKDADNLRLGSIRELLNAAHLKRENSLMQKGLFENINVITDRENCYNSFPTPFYRGSVGTGRYPFTQDELHLNDISRQLRLKTYWWEKCFIPHIVKKWIGELFWHRDDKANKKWSKIISLVIEQFQLIGQIGLSHDFQLSAADDVYQTGYG
jgi:hypothetical protein